MISCYITYRNILASYYIRYVLPSYIYIYTVFITFIAYMYVIDIILTYIIIYIYTL